MTGGRTTFRLLLTCTLVLGFSRIALAQASRPVLAAGAVVKPAERTKDCTGAGCHAKEKAFKVQHGPVAVGACDTCHTYSDEKKHTFALKQQKEALCTFCHIGGAGGVGKVVHKPVADGDCLGCHNPHGGNSRALLRKDDMAALCASCHQDVTKGKKYAHGPVGSGSCVACHNSHRGDHAKLLIAEGKELCNTCHDQMGKQMAAVKVTHKPVMEGDCQQCHETHASDYKMQLKKAPRELCESCHEPIKKEIASATFKHTGATDAKDACLNCHTSHGGNLAKLMKAEPAKACLSCHDKKVEVAGTTSVNAHTVGSVATIADPGQNKHGPLRDGDCSGCHTPHGGQVSRLLAKPYPEAFYQPFDIEKYALCFSCHDKQLVLQEKTKGLTKFRNGEQNLHFAHVNKQDKGRNCRACHSTHTSTQAMHIRETVPFGKWEMPIEFKPSETGGSCKPGCHEAMTYDRDKPAKNKPLTQLSGGK